MKEGILPFPRSFFEPGSTGSFDFIAKSSKHQLSLEPAVLPLDYGPLNNIHKPKIPIKNPIISFHGDFIKT